MMMERCRSVLSRAMASLPPAPLRTPRAALAAALVAALSLLGAACASDDTAGDTSTADEGGSDPAPAGSVEAGDILLTDVVTGSESSLDAVLANEADKPKLAWFWAPFCPTCRGEAPELDAFMAENADRVDMVGIGTRDDYGLAQKFQDDTGVVNFPLYWEETGNSWVDNAVAAQPYMILFVDGEDVERWPGGASVRQIEDALAKY